MRLALLFNSTWEHFTKAMVPYVSKIAGVELEVISASESRIVDLQREMVVVACTHPCEDLKIGMVQIEILRENLRRMHGDRPDIVVLQSEGDVWKIVPITEYLVDQVVSLKKELRKSRMSTDGGAKPSGRSLPYLRPD